MSSLQFLNLTPHELKIRKEDGSTLVLPVDGPAPRLEVHREAVGVVEGVSMVRSKLGDPVGLPDPVDGVILIVSALVAEHESLSHRRDLAYPGEPIRDDFGRIVAAKGLCVGPGWIV